MKRLNWKLATVNAYLNEENLVRVPHSRIEPIDSPRKKSVSMFQRWRLFEKQLFSQRAQSMPQLAKNASNSDNSFQLSVLILTTVDSSET